VSKGTAVDPSTDPALRFDPLFEDHYQAIYRYCLRRVGPDAEDATADVFAVAWRRLDQMPEGEATRAWLFGVASRVVGNQYRSRQRRHRLNTRLQAQEAGGTTADTVLDPEIDVLYEAFDSLSAGDQELLRLSSWEGLTRNEIAQVLGIRENAVDQRLHRARSRLRARMARIDPIFTKSEENAT
jgi:RNA polymerase sigma-70 factor (ECF subfamily)